MTTHENGEPMPAVWRVESRPSPFEAKAVVVEPVVTIATAKLDSRGTE